MIGPKLFSIGSFQPAPSPLAPSKDGYFPMPHAQTWSNPRVLSHNQRLGGWVKYTKAPLEIDARSQAKTARSLSWLCLSRASFTVPFLLRVPPFLVVLGGTRINNFPQIALFK